jgi:hypothetical protein
VIAGVILLVHRSEVLANPNAQTRTLYQFLATGSLTALLKQKPRTELSSDPPQRRLSAGDIDRLVKDYQAGVGSTRTLASIYGVSRATIAGHLRARDLKLGFLRLSESEVARANELRNLGMSLNAIGRELGRDPKTIKQSLT